MKKSKAEKQKAAQVDYCQFLLISQINYTQTYFADHSSRWSHDQINRFLGTKSISPREVWANVKDDLILSPNGYLLFDDTVASKIYSKTIELTRRQWSGNAKKVIEGIGIVTMVYVNPDSNRFWIIDYRIFDPQRDGKSKLDHLMEMLTHAVYAKNLAFSTVLFDSWYASRKILRYVEKLEKIYYCPIKSNRLVDDSDGSIEHRRVDSLQWSEAEAKSGKLVHIKKFPKGHQLKLFRLALSTERTEYVVTNDLTQDSSEEAQTECSLRWKIEQFHREAKQTTGLEKCQCRKQRAQRNHIGCAMLVWVTLNRRAQQARQSVYQIKHSLLDDYVQHQLRSPTFSVSIA